MSIREQIIALPSHYVGSDYEALGFMSSAIHHKAFHTGLDKAADLAEARERELLERQAAMIAELRDIPEEIGHDEDGNAYTTGIISMKKLRAIINKYEVLK